MINVAWGNQGAGWVAAIAALAGAIIGAAATYMATRQSVEAARKRDNFCIRKEHLADSIRNLAGAVRSSSVLRDEAVDRRLRVDDLVSRVGERVAAIDDGMAAAPWVYSKEARAIQSAIENARLALETERKRLRDVYEANPTPSNDPEKLTDEVDRLVQDAWAMMGRMRDWAQAELDRLNACFVDLIENGIPR